MNYHLATSLEKLNKTGSLLIPFNVIHVMYDNVVSFEELAIDLRDSKHIIID